MFFCNNVSIEGSKQHFVAASQQDAPRFDDAAATAAPDLPSAGAC
jgi:hypothetical protein